MSALGSWALLLSLSLAMALPGVVPRSGWASEDPGPSCDRGIAQYLKDRLSFKKTRERTKELVTFQKEYWKEVKDSRGERLIETGKNMAPMRYSAELMALCRNAPSVQGCIKDVMRRVVVMDRQHPDDIRWKELLYSPGDWLAAPLVLPFELLQNRYNLTTPSKLVLGLPLLSAATITIDDALDERFERLLKEDATPGLGYLRQLGDLGLLEPGFIAKQLGLDTSRLITYYTHEHVDDFESWRESHGHPSYVTRLSQLKKLGLLRSRAELTKISRRAFEIFQDEQKKSDASLATRFEESWLEHVNHDPFFKQYPPELRRLLGMIFTTPFEIEGHSDYELLARSLGLKVKSLSVRKASHDPLNALRSLSQEMSAAPLVWVAWETEKHPEAAQRKKERWAEKYPKENHPFLRRVDLPLVRAWEGVQFDHEGSGDHLSDMSDELSYWELVWKDQRFADIKASYLKKKTGELEALKLIQQRVKSLNEIYAEARKSVPAETSKLCSWAGESEKEASNVLIQGPVSEAMKRLVDTRTLSPSEQESCRVEIAESIYESYIRELPSRKGAQVLVAPLQPGDGLDQVLALCPQTLSPKSCHSSEKEEGKK